MFGHTEATAMMHKPTKFRRLALSPFGEGEIERGLEEGLEGGLEGRRKGGTLQGGLKEESPGGCPGGEIEGKRA